MSGEIVPLTPEVMALIASADPSLALVPFTREIFLLDVVVAGTTYCDCLEELEPKLEKGTRLKMVRAPENSHDELAIALWLDDRRLGWIPREMNAVVSRLMDAGKAFFARVESKERRGRWLKVDCKVFMVE